MYSLGSVRLCTVVAVPATGGGVDATSSAPWGAEQKLKMLTRVSRHSTHGPAAARRLAGGDPGSALLPERPRRCSTSSSSSTARARRSMPTPWMARTPTPSGWSTGQPRERHRSSPAGLSYLPVLRASGALQSDRRRRSPTATLDINSQGVLTHLHEAATAFAQQELSGGAATSAISLGPGADLVTRVTYHTSQGQWDVFLSTTPDGNFCLFRGLVVRG